jgi:hypothetical protein
MMTRYAQTGGVDSLGRKRSHRVPPSGAEFERGLGVAEQFVTGSVPGVSGPVERVFERLFRCLFGDALGVAVPVAGVVDDVVRHVSGSATAERTGRRG